jgi:hypothetical protein
LANVVEDEGDFTVAEGHGHPLVSKKWKNPSSALCMKRTWVQALQRFSTCSLSLLASGTDLKSRKGLYSGFSVNIQYSLPAEKSTIINS